MIQYRKLSADELTDYYFHTFNHHQKWDKQWVKVHNVWSLESFGGSRSWSDEKRIWISKYIKNQIENGGFAIGAFKESRIVGFICINGALIDSYTNLTMLFVDDEFQRMGIGKNLISYAKEESYLLGAEKLFISAIPSEDTIAFYFSIGCKDANTIISEFVDTEKDRYLELDLKTKAKV